MIIEVVFILEIYHTLIHWKVADRSLYGERDNLVKVSELEGQGEEHKV